jgi:hypothetical protein
LSGVTNSSNSESLNAFNRSSQLLPTLSNYEHSYFFYLHRFDFYNTLGNLTVSSNFKLTSELNRQSDSGRTHHNNHHFLQNLLKASLVINHDTTSLVYSLRNTITSTTTSLRSPQTNLLVEFDKSLLSNRSNIETWLNLFEDAESLTGNRTLGYYDHTLTLPLNCTPSRWGLDKPLQESSLKQNPYYYPLLEATYTADLLRTLKLVS